MIPQDNKREITTFSMALQMRSELERNNTFAACHMCEQAKIDAESDNHMRKCNA